MVPNLQNQRKALAVRKAAVSKIQLRSPRTQHGNRSLNQYDHFTSFRLLGISLIIAVRILACFTLKVARTIITSASSLLQHISFTSFFGGLLGYIKAHPISFALDLVGGILTTASTAGLSIPGMLGISAGGPLATSYAARLQPSYGLVAKGSLFAYLQRAGMNGTVRSTLWAYVARGGGLVGTGAVVRAVESGALKKMPGLFSKA